MSYLCRKRLSLKTSHNLYGVIEVLDVHPSMESVHSITAPLASLTVRPQSYGRIKIFV